MIIVTDAAPLIFLAKLNRLDLISQLFGKNILVPALIADEVLHPPLPPGEELRLQRFLKTATIAKTLKSRKKSTSLSRADLAVYELAVKRKADYVLSDDKLLRTLLATEGLVPLGTLGLLVHATTKELLTKEEARNDLDQLINNHKLRISIELYKRVLQQLDFIP